MVFLNEHPINYKYLDRQAPTNSVDFNQTSSKGVV